MNESKISDLNVSIGEGMILGKASLSAAAFAGSSALTETTNKEWVRRS